jgi:putative Ca2+/H+ antiporter (TMEM165/GDT1 family)
MQPIDTAWKAFFSTFASTFLIVFLAELGDKTQLTTLAMAANSRARWAVFLGSALALATISLLTVLSCEILLKFVNIRYIKYATGLLFLIIGVIILIGR